MKNRYANGDCAVQEADGMFNDLKLVARDEDEMEDFRDYDDEAGGEPAKLDEYEEGDLEDDDEEEIVAVISANPVVITEIIEVVEEGVPSAPAAPTRKPAKKARKAAPAPIAPVK